MVSMSNDDTNAIQRWLEDPTTHIEDAEKTKKQTELIWCARKGSHQCLQLLLDAGANVNATMVAGATATYVGTLDSSFCQLDFLSAATQENQERCVVLMVKYKADVTQGRSDTGATPLYCATQVCCLLPVRVLRLTSARQYQDHGSPHRGRRPG